MKNRWPNPTYKVDMTGADHSPKFQVKLLCNGLSALGSASTKVDAKKDAASNWFTAYSGQSRISSVSSKHSNAIANAISNTPVMTGVAQTGSPSSMDYDNPIGLLQEYTQSACRGSNQPVYSEGPSTSGFLFICQFQEKQATGTGSTKKEAKSAAANHMLKMLNVKYGRKSKELPATTINVSNDYALDYDIVKPSPSRMSSTDSTGLSSSFSRACLPSSSISCSSNSSRTGSATSSPGSFSTGKDDLTFFRSLLNTRLSRDINCVIEAMDSQTDFDYLGKLKAISETADASLVVDKDRYGAMYDSMIKVVFKGSTVLTGYGCSDFDDDEATKAAALKVLMNMALAMTSLS